VELGASKVIFGVRTIKKGEDAKAAIEQRTGKKDRIEVWPIDMGSYPSIKSFAEKASQLPQLDIAILNAGIHNASYKTSDYGFEEDLQINALSTAYLGLLLLPKLKASKTSTHTPVLEIVTSGVHKTVELKDEQKQAENLLQSFNDSSTSFNARKNYAISKLLAMYVMQSLGKLAESSTGELDVIVNSACVSLSRNMPLNFAADKPYSQEQPNQTLQGTSRLLCRLQLLFCLRFSLEPLKMALEV